MVTDPRGRPHPRGSGGDPGGRAELWKGHDTQCCQLRWQLGPPHPGLGTSFFPTSLEHAAGSEESQLQSPPQQGFIFHSPPPGSRGAFSAPKIPPNSLPGAESSSTRGGLENAQGFGIWAALGANPSLKFPVESLDPEGHRSEGAQHPLERGWWWLGGTKGPIATSEGHGRRKTPPAWSQILPLDWCQQALSWPQLSPFHPGSLPDPPTELGLPKNPL